MCTMIIVQKLSSWVQAKSPTFQLSSTDPVLKDETAVLALFTCTTARKCVCLL